MSKFYNPVIEEIEEKFFDELDNYFKEVYSTNRSIEIKELFKSIRKTVMSRYTPITSPFDTEKVDVTDEELLHE